MNNTIKISKAELSDMEEILALQKKAYLSEASIYDDFTIPPLHQTLDAVEKEFNQGYVLKAVTDNDKIVGSVRLAITGDTAYIGKLIVDENYQNKGLGRKLLVEAEALIKDKVSRFELFTGFKSEKNLHIYTSLGYKEFKHEQISERLTMVFLEKVE